MQVTQGIGKFGQLKFAEYLLGQQFCRSFFLHEVERLVDQVSQTPLLDAFGHRINRRQRVGDNRTLPLAQNSILGVYHLEPHRTGPDVTETSDGNAILKLHKLLARKVKETERHLSTAVTDTNQHVASAAIYRFGKQDLTADQAPHAGPNGADTIQCRAVFISKRQKKKQVFDPEKIKSHKGLRQRGANTI